jgi:CRP-like cAMP-binding protein
VIKNQVSRILGFQLFIINSIDFWQDRENPYKERLTMTRAIPHGSDTRVKIDRSDLHISDLHIHVADDVSNKDEVPIQAILSPSAASTCHERPAASAETLYGVDAFRELTVAQRQALAKLCHIRGYKTGQHVVSYHDHSREVYFVISGRLQAITFSVTGKQVTFQDIEAGAMFGELSAIDGQPRSAFVIALSDSMICSMTHDDFWHVLKHYPDVSAVTLHRLTSMIRHLCDRIFQISALPVKNRIHAELLRLAVQHMVADNQATISPAPTHADIAHHIGTHREAVSRELNELRRNGLIGSQNNPLLVKDVNRLREMVEQITGFTVTD